jgi:hypothetical protein
MMKYYSTGERCQEVKKEIEIGCVVARERSFRIKRGTRLGARVRQFRLHGRGAYMGTICLPASA